MYIEAEAKMDSFQAQDGTQRTALNLALANISTGNFEALSRPRVESSSESGGAESDTDAAHEPLSGIGAS
jgi:hypothetical protein